MNIPIDLVEHGVFHYPKVMEGWRFYRIEYGGHGMECICEGSIWLPPNVDPAEFEEYINDLTMPEEKGN